MASPRSSFLGPRRDERGLVGLENVGNTCYFNSVTQCLSHTTPLLEYILDHEYLSDVRSSSGGVIVRHFSDLIRELWSPPRRPYVNPQALKDALSRYAPRFSGSSQQDAQECLKYFLEALHTDVNRAPILNKVRSDKGEIYDPNKSYSMAETWRRYLSKDDSKICDIFAGLLRSDLICTRCRSVSTIYEPFWDLSLSIPSDNGDHGHSHVTLHDCLELFTREEMLRGDEKPNCSKCRMKQSSVKHTVIERFPKVLVIHLKRFSSGRPTSKVNTTVDFPVDSYLEMVNYSTEERTANPLYELYGVVYHRGSVYSGHYWASCKHPYSGQWHRFNDSSVSREGIGPLQKPEAYILFYRLKNSIVQSM